MVRFGNYIVDPGANGGQPTTIFVRAVDNPPILVPTATTSTRFGDSIELIGYTAERQQGEDGIMVVLRWRTLGVIDRDYTVFVHAVDRNGRLVAQSDGQPVGGRRPTSTWKSGDIVLDAREIRGAQLGDVANLKVGWYSLQTLERHIR